MTLALTPQHEELIKRKVASGQYGSPYEVIAKALELLDEYDRELAELREEIQMGFDSSPPLPGEQVMAELLRKANVS